MNPISEEYNTFPQENTVVDIKPKYDNIYVIDSPTKDVYQFVLTKVNAFAEKYTPNANPSKSRKFVVKNAVKDESAEGMTMLFTNDALFLEQFNSIEKTQNGIILTYNYLPKDDEDEDGVFEKWNNSRLLQIVGSDGNNAVVENFLQSGGKRKTMKKTNKKVKVGNVQRVVYVGTRGGQYVKMNGGFVSLSKLNKH